MADVKKMFYCKTAIDYGEDGWIYPDTHNQGDKTSCCLETGGKCLPDKNNQMPICHGIPYLTIPLDGMEERITSILVKHCAFDADIAPITAQALVIELKRQAKES